MFKKLNKTQIIIFISIIIFIILLIFGIIFCINKFNKNDIKDTGIKMAEESTNTTSKKEIITESKINEEKETELETTTEKEKITTEEEKEKETTKLTVITTNPTTTAKPTEPVTQPVKEVVTNPPTTTAAVTNNNNNNQYRDPYTGDIISKEEYDSIMNEMNNPEPTTTQAPQENVYVLNDDGTINFKKSKIYGGSMDEILLNYILNSHEFQNHFAGKNIIHISGQNGMITHYIIYCHIKLENGELITFHFDENWNIIED